jgi:hypothetical protein
MNHLIKAEKFNNKDIFWSGGSLVYENGEYLNINGVILDEHIHCIGCFPGDDLWMFENFVPRENSIQGYCTEGSQIGNLGEMRTLFLKDLKKFGELLPV